jgi:PTS system N-acetylglucosamine-specific IIC component
VARTESAALPEPTLRRVVAALGGTDNIRSIEAASTRVRVNIVDGTLVDRNAMATLGLRGMAMAAPDWVHLLVGAGAEPTAVALRSAAGL